MFKTEDIIGDIVFVSLVNEQDFELIGITKSGHYLVKGIDHIGLWLQHPGISTKNQEITLRRPSDIINKPAGTMINH